MEESRLQCINNLLTLKNCFMKLLQVTSRRESLIEKIEFAEGSWVSRIGSVLGVRNQLQQGMQFEPTSRGIIMWGLVYRTWTVPPQFSLKSVSIGHQLSNLHHMCSKSAAEVTTLPLECSLRNSQRAT